VHELHRDILQIIKSYSEQLICKAELKAEDSAHLLLLFIENKVRPPERSDDSFLSRGGRAHHCGEIRRPMTKEPESFWNGTFKYIMGYGSGGRCGMCKGIPARFKTIYISYRNHAMPASFSYGGNWNK
jgi:hypothetical protein